MSVFYIPDPGWLERIFLLRNNPMLSLVLQLMPEDIICLLQGYTKLIYGTYEIQYTFFKKKFQLKKTWKIIYGETSVVCDDFMKSLISSGEALQLFTVVGFLVAPMYGLRSSNIWGLSVVCRHTTVEAFA